MLRGDEEEVRGSKLPALNAAEKTRVLIERYGTCFQVLEHRQRRWWHLWDPDPINLGWLEFTDNKKTHSWWVHWCSHETWHDRSRNPPSCAVDLHKVHGTRVVNDKWTGAWETYVTMWPIRNGVQSSVARADGIERFILNLIDIAYEGALQ